MAESTLVTTYDLIRQRVGDLRGYGTTIADWTTEQKEKVEFCLIDGSALFYNQANHEWSFLQLQPTVTLVEGDSDLELPWDFGFPTGYVVSFTSSPGLPMELTTDVSVLAAQVNSPSTGRPRLGAVVTEKKPGLLTGQRSHLIYWPTADDDYDINLRYSVLANALAAVTPIPYGGAAHGQTLMLACLYASDRLDQREGRYAQDYAIALEASKAFDRRVKPRVLGHRWDKQFAGAPIGPWGPDNSNTVTYTP